MTWLLWGSAALFVTGVGLAIWERRKKRTLLAHDLNATGPQTDADRERIRTEDALINRHSFGGHSGEGDVH
ncbi:hypothetical protein [Roseobacter sp. S98]|uniref:hypothetical protein n=1 Tax=Roseobacter algicola (ex Choi et al. 2025) (nom. illeg.) TaxID=3092138 RepID=UPI0035C6A325